MIDRPEDRYVKLETTTLANGKVVYKSARPKPIDTTPSDITITAADGDRLDIIANNVYGSPSQWWRIAAANRHVNGSLFLRPGTQLLIPKP